MKFILLLMLMISAVSCASHEKREPASVEEKTDVSRGINTDFYGGTR